MLSVGFRITLPSGDGHENYRLRYNAVRTIPPNTTYSIFPTLLIFTKPTSCILSRLDAGFNLGAFLVFFRDDAKNVFYLITITRFLRTCSLNIVTKKARLDQVVESFESTTVFPLNDKIATSPTVLSAKSPKAHQLCTAIAIMESADDVYIRSRQGIILKSKGKTYQTDEAEG